MCNDRCVADKVSVSVTSLTSAATNYNVTMIKTKEVTDKRIVNKFRFK